MIEAGAYEVLRFDHDYESPEDAAERIYRAMADLRRARGIGH
jgi:hypothetical protein